MLNKSPDGDNTRLPGSRASLLAATMSNRFGVPAIEPMCQLCKLRAIAEGGVEVTCIFSILKISCCKRAKFAILRP